MIVYLYTSPSNKSYCGITSQTPEKRAGSNFGSGYQTSSKFYKAIQKYGGLDNFKLTIIAECSSREEASLIEEQTIKEMRLMEDEFGYNLTSGGDNYHTRSDESIEKTKKTNLRKYGCENVFQNQEIKERSQETKQKRYGDKFFTNRLKNE